ncbi:MAG: Wzz/FepE/Etk N-terminal domain-containing protein [Microthrixaceae bacterium]
MDGEDTPTLADYLGLIRRRFLIIALAGALGALLGLAYLAKAEPGYDSTARLVLEQVPESPGVSTAGGGISPATTLTATQKSILRSDEVAKRAADRLGDDVEVAMLRDHSSVDVLPDSLALDVTYRADDPVAARDGAQALVDSYLELRQEAEESRRSDVVSELEQQADALNDVIAATSRRLQAADPADDPTTVTVLTAELSEQLTERGKLRADLAAWKSLDTTPGTVVSPASLPTDSSSLGAPIVLIGAIAAALVAGFVIALIRDRTDPKVRSSQDLQELVGSTPVNVITVEDSEADENQEWFGEWYGRAASRHAPGVEVAANGNGSEAESYRRLALRLTGPDGATPRFVLVTAAGGAPPEEVAANLAVTLGREGRRVLLIWSNLREDTLASYFSVPRGPGLGEVLANKAKLEDAVLEIPGCQGLFLLPVGSREEARDQLFRFSGLKDALADPTTVGFDQILLIAPSPTEYADALALAPQVDGVLVAIESASADRKELTATLDSLRSINAHLAGVVAL